MIETTIQIEFQPQPKSNPMTPEQIHLIRSSFALVAPRTDTAARYFYERLFALDPSLRALFHTDLEQQGRKLMRMLAAAVALLDHPRELQTALEALGRRHVGYGVEEHHYDTVGAALLWTLSTLLEEALSPEACNAWGRLYTVVATTMKAAAARLAPSSCSDSQPALKISPSITAANASATLAADSHPAPSTPLHPRSDCGQRALPANPSTDARPTATP